MGRGRSANSPPGPTTGSIPSASKGSTVRSGALSEYMPPGRASGDVGVGVAALLHLLRRLCKEARMMPGRASSREIAVTEYIMKRLTAEIEVEVTIHVWNAKDRSTPTKWRRTVPERAPHRAVSYREGPQIEPKMRPKSSLAVLYGLLGGCQTSQDSCTDHLKAGGSMARPYRLAAHLKVPHTMTSAGTCRAHVWHQIFESQAF